MDIQNYPFFEGIDPAIVGEIMAASTSHTFQEGDRIFQKGDPADYLYILQEGSIELIMRREDAAGYPLKGPGEVFGWSSIVEKGIYTSTAGCLTRTTVFRIGKADVEAVFDRHPAAAVKFYQRLGSIFSKRISKAIE